MLIACQQPKSKLIIEENIVWLQIKSLPSGNSFRAIVWKSKKCTKEELEKKNGKTKRREADWLKGANHRTYCSLSLPLSLALFLSLSLAATIITGRHVFMHMWATCMSVWVLGKPKRCQREGGRVRGAGNRL